jgi:hypothetical protein
MKAAHGQMMLVVLVQCHYAPMKKAIAHIDH